MPLMGLRQYARHRGVYLKAVQDAIANGRITTVIDKNGKKKIDSETADRDWVNNARGYAGRNAPRSKKGELGPTYADARAVREGYQAKLAKLEYEEKTKQVIDREQVKREAFEFNKRIRDGFDNIPSRIASEILGCKDAFEVEQLLIREFNKVYELLSKNPYE